MWLHNVERIRIVLLLLCGFGCSLSGAEDPNNNGIISPVVGILSQPQGETTKINSNNNKTDAFAYISASYVKWLESAGARSIPIPYDASDELVDELFPQINGVLFPGGGGPLSGAAKRLWKLALKANSKEKNDFFPVWGTCLGLEYMVMLASQEGESILQSGFNAQDVSLPLFLWPNNNKDEQNKHGTTTTTTVATTTATSTSRLYADKEIHRIVTSQQNAAMYNNHQMGIEPERFLQDSGLTEKFVITAVNWDRTGHSFVSTMEPIHPDQYPFYAVQFHPEKNTFEYGTVPGTNMPYQNINHSPDAVTVSLYMAQFFVKLVRQNMGHNRHAYTMVDKYPLVYSYEMKRSVNFEQFYVIPSAQHWETKSIDDDQKKKDDSFTPFTKQQLLRGSQQYIIPN